MSFHEMLITNIFNPFFIENLYLRTNFFKDNFI